MQTRMIHTHARAIHLLLSTNEIVRPTPKYVTDPVKLTIQLQEAVRVANLR